MKIFTMIGSPNKDGSTAKIVNEIIIGAKENNYENVEFYVYDKEVKPCIACMACKSQKVDICVHNDDFTKAAKEFIEADVVIFGSPVYFGHITGPTKTFIDRMYTYVVDRNFNIRHIKGKKFITVVTSGAPVEYYASVTEYLNYWLGEFFKMEKLENIKVGDLMGPDSLEKQPEALKKALNIGKIL